ncbi:MAG TPA: T9SS type A sorting domain-containing protein [Bacteroidia bacterium]|nr:T9SS type A sorting domain-containing protein [Bacteroidia bacterium]
MSRCLDWSSYRETPDYYNTCSTNGMAPPSIPFGFQYPHTGSGYAGLETFDESQGPNSNYREIIGAQLISTLTVGVKYYITFFVNLTGGSFNTTRTNNLGLRFSKVPYSLAQPDTINNSADYYETAIITDTTNWTKLSGSFVADSAYKYVAIGIFFDDAHTDTSSFYPIYNKIAYYIVDDVCVSTDSIYASTWTGIAPLNNKQSHEIETYPNPSNGVFTIEVKSEQLKVNSIVEVYNILGEKVYSETQNQNPYTIDLSDMNTGIYTLKVYCNNQIHYKKLIVVK